MSGPASRPSRSPRLTVQPWPDPVIDAVGHEVRSPYVERFWLGLLGPVVHLAPAPAGRRARRRARGLRARPGPHRHRARARARGRAGTPRSSARSTAAAGSGPPTRSTRRPCGCGASCRRSPGSRSPGSRPPSSRPTQAWTDRPSPGLPVDELRERARGLALSLLELGEDTEATERQLHTWRLHPAIAHDAVAWAVERRTVTQRDPTRPTSRPRPRSPRRRCEEVAPPDGRGGRGALEPHDVVAVVGVEVGQQRGVGARHRDGPADGRAASAGRTRGSRRVVPGAYQRMSSRPSPSRSPTDGW